MTDTTNPGGTPLLEMHGIVKRFPGVVALGGVDLDVRAGEVHCLLGQNGAGKSTLIKVLSASYQPDEGEIRWEGEPSRSPPRSRPCAWGSRTIYQELDLVPEPTVAENIFLGHELSTGGFSQRSAANRRAEELLRRLGHRRDLAHPSGRPARSGGAADRQHGASAVARDPAARARRAVRGPRPGGRDNLFRVIRDLTAQGVAVVYISHRLEEIREIGDRLTVLKDGRTVGAGLAVKDTPTADLIKLMTGRAIEYVFPAREDVPRPGETVLAVRDLTLAGIFADVRPDGARRRDRRPRRPGRRRPLRDPRDDVRRSQGLGRHRGDRTASSCRAWLGPRRRRGRNGAGPRGAQEPGPAAGPGDLPQHHRVDA